MGVLAGDPSTRAPVRGATCPLSPTHSVPEGGKASPGSPQGTPKKPKVEPYSLSAQQSSLIKEDRSNAKLWSEILKSLKDGPVSAPCLPGSPCPHCPHVVRK